MHDNGLTKQPASILAEGSPDRFGYSWERFSALTPDQEEQFRRWTIHLDPASDWRGKTFLDAGCGAGRNSFWAMTYGAAGGLAIDVDDRSVEAARRNLAPFPSVEVRYQSIYDLQETGEFDIVFSIGVIHHLTEPGFAIGRMVQAAKPRGHIVIWVYGRENMGMYVHVMTPLRRAFFSWMPVSLVRLLALVPAGILWLLLRLGVFRIEYFRLLRRFSFAHLHHIVFDQMLPHIARYWTREEARSLLEQAGLVDIELHWVNEMSWSVIGTKPEPSH